MILLYLWFFSVLFGCSASSKFKIDWNACNNEMECFVLDQCITATSTQIDILNTYYADNPLENPDCAVGLQKRVYTNEKTLYIIQVNEALQTKKIELFHGDDPILSCKEDENGQIVVTSEHPSLKELNLKLYEDVSYFDNNLAHCAFTVEKMSSLSILRNSLKSSIRYDQKAISYIRTDNDMFSVALKKLRCDPDAIQDLIERQHYHVLPVKNKAGMSIDCANYKSDLGLPYDYHLYIKVADDDAIPAEKLECDFKTFTYNNGIDDVIIDDFFSAYCAVKLSKMCKNSLNCKGLCPVLTEGNNEKDATLECKDGKWLIGNTYYDGMQPNCETNNNNEPAFSMTYPDGKKKDLTEGQCFEKYDCFIHSKLDIIQCENNATDCGKVEAADRIYCQDPEQILMVYSGSSKVNETSGFRCDADTGMYMNGSIIIPKRARITCINLPDKEEAPMSDATVVAISAGAAIGSLLIAIAVSALVFIAISRRNRFRGAINNELWKITPLGSKKAQALDTFGKAILARPEQDVTLLDALKLLDVVIETEMEDPEVWAAIDTFLKRFHAVVFSVDYEIERFFNRYCYLQAKKIIDKHGWISSTPITKSNPQGLIRTCAIRLLTVARRNEPDAQNLIVAGFKSLQFNGIDQYPHCGLLWSLVSQQRVGNVELQDEFIQKLVAIVHDRENETEEEKQKAIADVKLETARRYGILKDEKIPESARFAQFGSIKQQCCFAIGTSDIGEVWKDAADIMLTTINEDWASLSQSIMNGVFSSSSGNTYNTMLEILNCHQGTDENEAQLGDLLFGSRDQLEQYLTVLVFNRRSIDAKEREHRFIRRERKEKRRIEQEKREKKEEKEDKEIKEVDAENNSDDSDKKRKEAEEKERIKNEEEKEEEEDNVKGPTPVFDKVKEIHRLFLASFNNERDDILFWLSGKIGKDEVKSQSKKESERITSQSNSSHSNSLQIIDPNGKTKDQLFVEKFVSAYHKQSDTKRVTNSLLSEEEKAKYRLILDRILATETVLGMRVYFAAQDVVEICRKMVEVCRTEPVLIEDVPLGITVVTDLHGQLYDLVRIFNANAEENKPGHEATRYLFTGDYVDRGDKALEVIMALFILKILHPDRFYVLRGNHEFPLCNHRYGFMEEILSRYEEEVGEYLYYTLNESFMFLSLCAIIGDQIFCAHGGISAGSFTRHELRLLRKPIVFTNQDTLVEEMTWSDPAKAIGYFQNTTRDCAMYYGEDVLLNALDRIGCTGLLRGHSVLQKGYQKLWPSCIALFTATAVDSKLNDGAVLRLFEDNTYQLVVLKHDGEREKVDLDHYGKKNDDELTTRQTGKIHERDE